MTCVQDVSQYIIKNVLPTRPRDYFVSGQQDFRFEAMRVCDTRRIRFRRRHVSWLNRFPSHPNSVLGKSVAMFLNRTLLRLTGGDSNHSGTAWWASLQYEIRSESARVTGVGICLWPIPATLWETSARWSWSVHSSRRQSTKVFVLVCCVRQNANISYRQWIFLQSIQRLLASAQRQACLFRLPCNTRDFSSDECSDGTNRWPLSRSQYSWKFVSLFDSGRRTDGGVSVLPNQGLIMRLTSRQWAFWGYGLRLSEKQTLDLICQSLQSNLFGFLFEEY